MTGAVFKLEAQGAILRLLAEGDWSTGSVAAIDMALREVSIDTKSGQSELVVDLHGVTRLDTSGAFVLNRTASALKKQGLSARYDGASEEQQILIDKIQALENFKADRNKRRPASITVIERIGAFVVSFGREALIMMAFLGEVVSSLGEAVRNPRKLRLVPLVHHMEKAGFDALPLICLLNFLIGAVIAQQGATQLKQFGADVYTVNLISIIFLREVGILITAIIVAGRSGSAYTAEIGSMKMREEIDAMRTLGLDPMQMLVVPRVLALIIVLPLLTFAADIMGLIGGGVVALTQLNMAPAVYIDRVRDAAWFWTFGVGILRAPFMALAIALIACRAGLDVTGSAESVGSQTTRSVVMSIFLVIVIDALFAMFFTAIGL
ncbi:MAG: MlaE family ABC transporter permease [Parvibaculaceae bacterium]